MHRNSLLPVATTITSHGRILDLSKPIVMGILNATPDSFYSRQEDGAEGLLNMAEKMIQDGATILDIGGASTKPGQPIIDADEEMKRIMPVIDLIHHRFPDTWLSIDTYHSKVAKEAVEAGVSIVNDVSGARFDDNMLETVARLRVPYIAMHMQGTPATMQLSPHYTDPVTEVRDYLRQLADRCLAKGINDLIIDPGFGFGKTVEHNFQLLSALHTFRILGKPILAGLSRKSMICKPLNVRPADALNGTTALHVIALQQGANILRVHDVKEAMEVIRLLEFLPGGA